MVKIFVNRGNIDNPAAAPLLHHLRAAAWEHRNGPAEVDGHNFLPEIERELEKRTLETSMPALLTRMSIRPKVETAWSIRFWTCTGSDTSAWTATLRPPAAVDFL